KVQVDVGAVQVDRPLAVQANGVAEQVQLGDVQAVALDVERGVRLLEGGAVRPAQAEEFEQVEQKRGIVELGGRAVRHVGTAVALQGVAVVGLALQVQPPRRQAAQLVLRPQILAAEVRQLNLRRRQVQLVM